MGNAGTPRILLATDAFGRHRLRATVLFDAHVVLAISYDVPPDLGNYVHRACCSQVAISLCVGAHQMHELRELTEHHETRIDELPREPGDLWAGVCLACNIQSVETKR